MEGKDQRKDKITGAVMFGVSLVYLLGCWRLKMGTIKYPGPGFFPLVLGSLLLICTTIYLIRVFRTKVAEGKREEETAPEGKNYRAIFGLLACTAVYPFILEPLKFIASTLSVAFVMFVLLKPRRRLFSFFLAVAISVGSFLIFSPLLGVALPSGFLENLLFRFGG